jgi:tRNA A37 threonylcarbamoyladenosine dehydratase
MNGTEIEQIRHSNSDVSIGDVRMKQSFSNKPKGGYTDYYEKMTTYIGILENPAKAIDPNVTAQVFRPILVEENDSVFLYLDTASSRAGVTEANKKLELNKIAIIGVGGTGSYILDLVAKTPVREIHLFDGDEFLQHNAFRAPGATSGSELQKATLKVSYFAKIYSKMRRGIVAHKYAIDESNLEELNGMDFVFISIDGGNKKQVIIEKLEEYGIPFVDTGMGVQLVDDMLCGIVTLTTSTSAKRDHVRNGRVSFSDTSVDVAYSSNIQIAELNSLNATLAVIKWKKLFGFYKDYDNEHYCAYTIDGNHMSNEELV